MFAGNSTYKQLARSAVGILLLTASVWVNWPQKLPPVALMLATAPDGLNVETPNANPTGEATAPQVNTQALAKQGDLVFVWNDLLYLAEGASGSVRALSDSGQALAPTWSPDGEWVAYIRVTENSSQSGPLWLVRRDGSQAHEVQGLPRDLWVKDFVWSPTDNQLAVSVHGHGLWLVPTTGKPEQLDLAPWLYRAAWSPNGQYIAYNYCLSGDTPRDDGDHDVLCVIDIRNRQRYDLVQTHDAGIRLLGWWPDGNGILYWEVPAHGGSIATDGVMIQSVPLTYTPGKGQPSIVATGSEPPGTPLKRADANSKQPIALTGTLCYQDWTRFTRDGKLLVVDGYGREAWANKQLALLDPRDGQQKKLANPKGRVALDPALSATDGRIAFVTAPDQGPAWSPNDDEYKAWEAERTLHVRDQDGKLTTLTQAGKGIIQPQWSADGKQISFVAQGAIWTVAADNQSPAQKIVELDQNADNFSLYGRVNYIPYFSWFQP